jgi:putative hydrolase of HD superfamily
MALFHDFGEIYAGDFTPADDISPEEKSRREEESASQVFSRLPQGETYLALWREFEYGDTREARFVRQIDRLEMAFQASIYQRQGYPNLEGFFASARKALDDQQLLALLEEVQK